MTNKTATKPKASKRKVAELRLFVVLANFFAAAPTDP